MNDYFSDLDRVFDRRTDAKDPDEAAAALYKLEKIRLIVDEKSTASNYKIEQIKGVLNE